MILRQGLSVCHDRGLLVITDGCPESPLDVIGDPKTRQILAALNVQRQSVKEIAEHCELSQPTVYRRINELEEHDLVKKTAMVSPDGSHYHLYECRFSSAVIQLQGTDFEIDVVRNSSSSCITATIWNELRNLTD